MVYNRLELIDKLSNLDCKNITLQDIKVIMKNKVRATRKDKVAYKIKQKRSANYKNYNKETYKEFNVYIFYNANKEVLYVGRTTNLKERMRNHFYNPNILHNQEWKKDINSIAVCSLTNFEDMCVNEVNLINTLNSKYNIKDTDCEIEDGFDLCKLDFVNYSKNEMDKLIASKEVLVKDVLIKLEEHLSCCNDCKIILSDWIRENFYNEETSIDTIKSKITENIGKIKEVCSKFGYEYISPRGRGNKGYIFKN